MRKKFRGSALLWSICSLLVVAFVVTGLLAINKSYALEEINNIASRRADYLARSGVELTAGMIASNSLEDGNDSYTVLSSAREVQIEFEWGTAVITSAGGSVYRIASEATAGDVTRNITGLIRHDRTGKWEMEGYVKY